MGKGKDPRAEKERDYQHQRVIMAEFPHLYVQSRRRKKKGTSRTHRRKVRQVLHAEDAAGEYTQVDTVTRPKTMYFNQTAPLGEALKHKVQRRARTEAHNLYFAAHGPELAAGYFHDLLTRTQKNRLTREVAEAYQVLLSDQPQDGSERSWYLNVYRKAWLEAFLELHPGWESKILNWSRQVLED